MTAPLPGLPAPRRTPRPVPADGLAAAVRGGRARRRRAALAGGSGALALSVAVLVLPALGGDGRGGDSLRLASAPPTSTTAPEPSVGPTGAGPTPTAGSTPVPPGAGPGTTSPGPQATSAAGPGPTGSGAPGTAGTPAPPDGSDPGSREPYVEEPQTESAPAQCVQAGEEPTQAGPAYVGGGPSGCAKGVSGPSEVRSGGTATFTLHVCLSRGARDVALDYDGGQEHELVVRQGDASGPEVFRRSLTVHYPQGAHRRVLADGTCLVWTSPWSTETTAGDDVTPGDYHVTLSTTVGRYDGERVRADGQASSRGSLRVT